MDWDENYPRPLLQRERWQSLDGDWRFAFDEDDKGEERGWIAALPGAETIRVPFSYETKASGIGRTDQVPAVWYERSVVLEKPLAAEEEVRLHFEGSDFETSVWADGVFLGRHCGGYERFSFSFVPAGKCFRLTVRVRDSFSEEQPRGKQRYKPESWGCWYVQTTGIWKSVWLETAFRRALTAFSAAAEKNGTVTLCGKLGAQTEDTLTLSWEISGGGKKLYGEHPLSAEADGSFSVKTHVSEPLFWSPEDPVLYTLKARLFEDGKLLDEVSSYFAFRDIVFTKEGLLICGRPHYLRMILNQGYWPESGLTPPSASALKTDLEITERYGLNGMRLHQKTEDERLLALCDRSGMLVWNEMAAAYAYSPQGAAQFEDEWAQIVKQYQGHPSIIAWVPFNESWGIPEIRNDAEQQAFVRRIYDLTKALDPERPVITNDGWEHAGSDLLTIHDYRSWGSELLENHGDGEKAVLSGEKSYSWYGQKLFAEGFSYEGQPLLLSEYGGIAFESEGGWGYGDSVRDEAEYLARFLSQNEAVRKLPQFIGVCYTQLTDVEQEVNGLVTAGREDKLSPAGIEAVRASFLSLGS